jgi:hypothetical protein
METTVGAPGAEAPVKIKKEPFSLFRKKTDKDTDQPQALSLKRFREEFADGTLDLFCDRLASGEEAVTRCLQHNYDGGGKEYCTAADGSTLRLISS